MTAIINHRKASRARHAGWTLCSFGSPAHGLETGWVLCRMATAAGAALCLVALAAPPAWQGFFLAGLLIATFNDRPAAALAGIAIAALLIAAPLIGAAPWGSDALRWSGGIWDTSGEADSTALRTIAAIAILLLATPGPLPRDSAGSPG